MPATWITTCLALASGGAAGATITAVVNTIKGRKQPVGYRYEVVPVFKGATLGRSDLTATLNLSSPQGGYGQKIPNLSIINLIIVNTGNRDFSSFNFGVTLADGDSAVHCDANSSNRHHSAKLVTPLGPGGPTSEFDFSLEPFHRQDSYSFTLYVVVMDQKDSPGEIRLSSSEPIAFKNGPSVREIALEASKVALEVGAFKISLR